MYADVGIEIRERVSECVSECVHVDNTEPVCIRAQYAFAWSRLIVFELIRVDASTSYVLIVLPIYFYVIGIVLIYFTIFPFEFVFHHSFQLKQKKNASLFSACFSMR